jgi:hypothetical protein
MSSKWFAFPFLYFLITLLSSTGVYASGKPANQHQAGQVLSGTDSVAFAEVRLYQAGMRQRAAGAQLLGKSHSDASGNFEIFYKAPSEPNSVLYLVAEGQRKGVGHSPVKLAAVLDNNAIPAAAIINERTTVAMAYAMAQFTDGQRIGGKYPGLQNAAATAQNLVDLATGDVGPVLGNDLNSGTTTLGAFNSLANMLSACIRSADSCAALFADSIPPRGPAPRDTLQAMVNIAHNPWKSVSDLFTDSQQSSLYTPALGTSPDAWTLALLYRGDGDDEYGQKMDGPGNIAFDKDGNAWANNNYKFSSHPAEPVCGSNKVFKLTPTGGSAPGAPYFGGGLYGAGFGITLDPDGNIWVGNFGFQGVGCPLPAPPASPLSMSVSKFAPDGTALSPPDGIRKDDLLNQPQGTVSDKHGNIWAANCSGRDVTIIPRDDPDAMYNTSELGSKPFDVAFDTRGHAWVTVNNENPVSSDPDAQAGVVFELAPDGSIIGDPITTDAGIWRPMGIATDSRGNVWVSNSGIMNPPCEGTLPDAMIPPDDIGDNGENNVGASVTLIRPLGKSKREVITYGKTASDSRGGLALPWGIAVDGNDNVWVANFNSQQVSQLCGVRTEHCPPGKRTGDPISPDVGYGSDALTRNTAVEIDPSGNVWLTNNWIEEAEFQTNPGGHELAVFIGLAAPVRTPLIGPPERL